VKDELKLDELVKRSGVSARTVRYYVQRGLLPAPLFRGRDTAYGEEHLLRLQAIRRLQESYLPLDEIQAQLARLSTEELRKLGHGPVQALPAHPYRAPFVPMVPAPAPLPERWTRHELAPGLELHVSDSADRRVRALIEEIVRLVERDK
jgi:Ca-activated chloride channel family protein